jgi:hypothetical protein
VGDVKLLARWTGWCDPCETERPLVLTETGERGVRAWLRGVGAEDRELTLTCGICGEWQAVAYDEADEDETEVVEAPSAVVAVQPLGNHQVVVHAASISPYPVDAPAPRWSSEYDEDEAALELVAEGLDLLARATG